MFQLLLVAIWPWRPVDLTSNMEFLISIVNITRWHINSATGIEQTKEKKDHRFAYAPPPFWWKVHNSIITLWCQFDKIPLTLVISLLEPNDRRSSDETPVISVSYHCVNEEAPFWPVNIRGSVFILFLQKITITMEKKTKNMLCRYFNQVSSVKTHSQLTAYLSYDHKANLSSQIWSMLNTCLLY